MYKICFQNHPYEEAALSRFEVLTKPIYYCNDDRLYCATHHQDIFIQYNEGFTFVTGKASQKFVDIHITIPNEAPSLTLYTKADIRNG